MNKWHIISSLPFQGVTTCSLFDTSASKQSTAALPEASWQDRNFPPFGRWLAVCSWHGISCLCTCFPSHFLSVSASFFSLQLFLSQQQLSSVYIHECWYRLDRQLLKMKAPVSWYLHRGVSPSARCGQHSVCEYSCTAYTLREQHFILGGH